MNRILSRLLSVLFVGCAAAIVIGVTADIVAHVESTGAANTKVVAEDFLVGIIALIFIRWAVSLWHKASAPPN